MYHAQRATTGAADRSLINGRRQREEEMDGEGKAERNRERKEGKLTGSAPLLPSAIKEVRTQRGGGGGGGESVGPMLQAQLHVSPIIISHTYLN